MQEYDRGGLKMINLKNYICALKSIWIRCLLANDSNSDLYKSDWTLHFTAI